MKDYESYFKLFQSSWGILVGFVGTVIEDSQVIEDNLIEINSCLFLRLNIPIQNKYIHDNKSIIENGILWISDIIPNTGGKKIIEINMIDLNFCNFQIEGLFFGIANWICNYYQITMPNYHSKYDRIQNKYMFWFAENDAKSMNLLYPNGKNMP
jgi:hypothetical protein